MQGVDRELNGGEGRKKDISAMLRHVQNQLSPKVAILVTEETNSAACWIKPHSLQLVKIS